MEVGRPLSAICKGTGTWSGGVLRTTPLPLPNNSLCKQGHGCIQKQTLKLPTIGTTFNNVPKTFATRHGALLLFSDAYDIWRNQLKGSDIDEEEETADIVKQLKTLKELRRLVLSFGLDDESVIKGISAILHDDSFVRVRPGFSASRYTSSAIRLWDPKLVDKYLENDGINKSVVQRYFELLLPDVTVNGVVLKDTLLGSKPQNYKSPKLPSIKTEGHGGVNTDEMVDRYKAEARRKANVMVLPKIDFTDSSKSRLDHCGYVQKDNIKKKLIDPNQKKFWNNYENLSYDEKADLLLRMLVSRTEDIPNAGDEIEHLENEKGHDRKYIFPELKNENDCPPQVNQVSCNHKDNSSTRPLPPISKVNIKSTLEIKNTKNIHRLADNKTQPLQLLPDEIECPHWMDLPKFAYRPTKLTAHGISYSDQCLSHKKKHLNALVIQGTALNKGNFLSVVTDGPNARPLSLPSSFTSVSSNDDLLKRYIHNSGQYNRNNRSSTSAKYNNLMAPNTNIGRLHNKPDCSGSKPMSNILSNNFFPRAESTTSSTTDDMESSSSTDLLIDGPCLKNTPCDLSNGYSDMKTSGLQDTKTDLHSQHHSPNTTKESNYNRVDSSSSKKRENINDYINSNSEKIREADDESIKASHKMDTCDSSICSIQEDFLGIIATPDMALNTKENDTVKNNIVFEDTFDILKGNASLESDTDALDCDIPYTQAKTVINDDILSTDPIVITNDDIPSTDAILLPNDDIPSTGSVVPPSDDILFTHPIIITSDFAPLTQPDLGINEDNPSLCPAVTLSEEIKSTPVIYTSPISPLNDLINTTVDDSQMSNVSCVHQNDIHDVKKISPPQCHENIVHGTSIEVSDTNDVLSHIQDNITAPKDGEHYRNNTMPLDSNASKTQDNDNLPLNEDMEVTKNDLLDKDSLEDINDILHVESDVHFSDTLNEFCVHGAIVENKEKVQNVNNKLSSNTQDVKSMAQTKCHIHIEDKSGSVVVIKSKPDQLHISVDNDNMNPDIVELVAEAPDLPAADANSVTERNEDPVTSLIDQDVINDVENEIGSTVEASESNGYPDEEIYEEAGNLYLLPSITSNDSNSSSSEEDIDSTDSVEEDWMQDRLNVIVHEVLSRPGSGVDLQKDINTATGVYKTKLLKEESELVLPAKVDGRKDTPEKVKANNISNLEDVTQENQKTVKNHVDLSTGPGIKANVDDSTDHDIKGKVVDSMNGGVKGNVKDSTDRGVKGNVDDSSDHGVKGNVDDSTDHDVKGNVDDSTDHGVKSDANDPTDHEIKDNVNDSMEHGNTVEVDTNESVSDEKEKETANLNPEPFRVGAAIEEKPVFLDNTPKPHKKLPQGKKKNKDQKNIDSKKMTKKIKRTLLEEQSLNEVNTLHKLVETQNLEADMGPHSPTIKSEDSPSSSTEEYMIKISVEDLDENVVDEEKAAVENEFDDENEKNTLLAKKVQREKSAAERRATVERKRELLQEKRRLEKEEKLRETEEYILKAQEEDRRNEEVQKKMEEEIQYQEEERMREQEMEKKRLEAEELKRRIKEEDVERLKRKKIAEEESQRKKMEILMAQRQMELHFRKTQEEMAKAIEADMAEKEKILMQQMAEEERKQYEENKKLEEELQRKEDEDRAQLLELKRKEEEERRERELEELLRLETKQLFTSSARRANRLLEIQQQVSRAYSYSYFNLFPVIFFGAPIAIPKKRARKVQSLSGVLDKLEDSN